MQGGLRAKCVAGSRHKAAHQSDPGPAQGSRVRYCVRRKEGNDPLSQVVGRYEELDVERHLAQNPLQIDRSVPGAGARQCDGKARLRGSLRPAGTSGKLDLSEPGGVHPHRRGRLLAALDHRAPGRQVDPRAPCLTGARGRCRRALGGNCRSRPSSVEIPGDCKGTDEDESRERAVQAACRPSQSISGRMRTWRVPLPKRSRPERLSDAANPPLRVRSAVPVQ